MWSDFSRLAKDQAKPDDVRSMALFALVLLDPTQAYILIANMAGTETELAASVYARALAGIEWRDPTRHSAVEVLWNRLAPIPDEALAGVRNRVGDRDKTPELSALEFARSLSYGK